MNPATHRRRRHVLLRRHSNHTAQRGFATFLLAIFAVFGLMIGGSVLGTTGGIFAAYTYFASDLPDPRIIDEIDLPQSTYVYDRTGETLLTRFECQNRDAVSFDEIPEDVINATVAIEDRTFWSNDGIDYPAAVRAALANLRAGEIVQGASTITQQMIDYAGALRDVAGSTQVDEDVLPRPEASGLPAPESTAPPAEPEAEEVDVCEAPVPRVDQSFEEKIRENIMAQQVTRAYPGRQGKEVILSTYLNLVFYGHQSYGIKAAAANYFGITDLSQLSLAQSAFLAGLPQAPSAYDPFYQDQGPERAMDRRDQVLRAMREEGYITAAEFREALGTTWEEMGAGPGLQVPLREPHFVFRVRAEAEQILASLPGIDDPPLAVRTGGYRITTTLDYQLQQVAKERVAYWVRALDGYNVHNGALVALNSQTGEIVAYVGSVDYYNREDPRVRGQFDVAGLGRRQPGSAFKPIAYTSAFKDRTATVGTLLVDAKTDFGANYIPQNADLREHGPMLAVDALRYSLNIPSVKMQHIATTETTAQFAESLGIAGYDYIMGLHPGLTLALGSVPVNLTRMTQAYASFAAQGTLHPATSILEIRDRTGRVVYSLERDGPDPSQPMTPGEAYLMHYILEGNTDPARNLFWGRQAMLTDPAGTRRQAAFKTGTTNDFKDASGFGYVPGSLTTGVWLGNNNSEEMVNAAGEGLFAAQGPLFLWRDFMQPALNQAWEWNGGEPVPQTAFSAPADEISLVDVCRWTGLQPSGACGRTARLPFLKGTEPGPDPFWPNGCLDLARYERETGHPNEWVEGARVWSNRLVNGQTGGRGPIQDPDADPARLQYPIAPLYGESGFPNVCGERRATPTPTPADDDDDGGGGPGPPDPPGPPGNDDDDD